MKKYKITFSEIAKNDFLDIIDYISERLKSHLTAERFADGMIESIESLKNSAQSYQIVKRHFAFTHILNIRRINYKDWAILYSISDDIVKIERIIHGSLIKEKNDDNR